MSGIRTDLVPLTLLAFACASTSISTDRADDRAIRAVTELRDHGIWRVTRDNWNSDLTPAEAAAPLRP